MPTVNGQSGTMVTSRRGCEVYDKIVVGVSNLIILADAYKILTMSLPY